MGTCCTSTSQRLQKYVDPLQIQDQSYSKQWFLQQVSKENMNKLPYSAIGLVECQLQLVENGNRRTQLRSGTGCLISPNLVLTCAHILYKKSQNPSKVWSLQKLRFHPALHGKSTESFSVANIYYPFEFILPEVWDRQYDYALLKLERKVTQRKFLKLGQNFNCFHTASPIGIYGYPYSKTEFKRDEDNHGYVEAYQHGIRFKNLLFPKNQSHPSTIILYKNFTEMGHSGSPMVIFSRNNDVLIAIHLGKANEQFINEGRLISDSVYSNLIKWQKACQADSFQRVILNFFQNDLPRPKLAVNIEKPFEFRWNRSGPYSKCFLIIKSRIYKIIEGFSYICSESYLPQIYKLRIKINKYQGYYYSLGITNDTNKLQKNPQSQQSVVYHSNRIQKQGSIFMNSKSILLKNGYLFVGEGGVIKIEMNIKMQTVSFKNQANNSKFSFSIGNIFQNKPVGLYVVLDSVGDSIEIIQGQ